MKKWKHESIVMFQHWKSLVTAGGININVKVSIRVLCFILLCTFKVLLHSQLEKNLPKFILQKVDKNEVVEYPNARKARLGMIDQFFKYFQPKSTRKGRFIKYLCLWHFLQVSTVFITVLQIETYNNRMSSKAYMLSLYSYLFCHFSSINYTFVSSRLK